MTGLLRTSTVVAGLSTAERYCAWCAHWDGAKTWSGREQPGLCRRYAPTTPAGWPATSEADWCGEWDAAEHASDPDGADVPSAFEEEATP